MTKKKERAVARPLSRAGEMHEAELDKIDWREAAAKCRKPLPGVRLLSPARWDELKAALAPIEKIEKQHHLQARGRKLDAMYALERKWLAEDEAALAGANTGRSGT